MTGPVPETRTRPPARTARENPITGSYGDPEAIRWRSGSACSTCSARWTLLSRTST